MSNVKRDSNWGSLPDYSDANWTLRTPRTGSWTKATGAYAPGSERIPNKAWFGVIAVVAAFWAAFVLGTAMGY